MSRIPAARLRALRNDLDLPSLLAELRIPARSRGRRTAFRCPVCERVEMRLHPRVNLARCFGCERSFNPIDLVMTERRVGFRAAVDFLERCSPCVRSDHDSGADG